MGRDFQVFGRHELILTDLNLAPSAQSAGAIFIILKKALAVICVDAQFNTYKTFLICHFFNSFILDFIEISMLRIIFMYDIWINDTENSLL